MKILTGLPCGLNDWAHDFNSFAPGVCGLYLGGSGALGLGTFDDDSDLDINAYTRDRNFEVFDAVISNWIPQLGKIRRYRRRGAVGELHIDVSGRDYDIKFRDVSVLDQFADTKPNLDELYLEALSAYSCYQELVTPDPLCGNSLLSLRERIKSIVMSLEKIALDRYGKMIHSAVRQQLNRALKECASTCINLAIDALVIYTYANERVVPPPFKWRNATSLLGRLHSGNPLIHLVHSLCTEENADPIKRLTALKHYETRMNLFDDPWWWEDWR